MRYFWVFRLLESFFQQLLSNIVFWATYAILIAIFISISAPYSWHTLFNFTVPQKNNEGKRSFHTDKSSATTKAYFDAFRDLKQNGKVATGNPQKTQATSCDDSSLEISAYLELEESAYGIGLKTTALFSESALILRFCEAWTISTNKTHPLGLLLNEEWRNGNIPSMVVLMGNLLYEKYRGDRSLVFPILQSMPSTQWYQKNGIFSISEEDYNFATKGTSIYREQKKAHHYTQLAFEYFNSHPIKSYIAEYNATILLQEVQWAYCTLMAFGYFGTPFVLDSLVLLFPLYFMRRTVSQQDPALVSIYGNNGVYEVRANALVIPGTRILFYDSTLSAGSMVLYRGLWMTGGVRMNLEVSLPFPAETDEQTLDFLKPYQCYGPAVRFWMTKGSALNYHLLSCARLISYCQLRCNLEQLKQQNWFDAWPYTLSISGKSELNAMRLAISLVQNRLEIIVAANKEVKIELGKQPLSFYPVIQVRQAETNILSETIQVLHKYLALTETEELFAFFRLKEQEALLTFQHLAR